MAKKIDIKRTLGSPTPSFSVDAIEEMTRMIHAKKTEPTPTEETPPSTVETKVEKKETKKKTTTPKTVEKSIENTPAKRGRKPSPPASDERMIRVSVDLPESVFIQLKVKVIQEKTDMKTWVWRLVEKELAKK
jgi:hypothetical protein